MIPLNTDSAIDIDNLIIEVLNRSASSLTSRQISARVRRKCPNTPDFLVVRSLRDLYREGRVDYVKGRWHVKLEQTDIDIGHHHAVHLPRFSDEARSILSKVEHPFHEVSAHSSDELTQENFLEGPWSLFRRLVRYYRQCIRNEEGANASAFQNQIGDNFIYLRQTGRWFPKSGLSWRLSLPIGPHISSLLKKLPGPSDEQTLVMGYPIQATYISKEEEPDVALIQPIFYFSVEYTISRGGLVIFTDLPKPEVNLGWMDYAFSRRPQQQSSFLSACGFINRHRPNDEFPGTEREEGTPNIEHLVNSLSAFMEGKLREPIEIENIRDHLISEPFDSGIYNRAVLMLAKRTRYTVTLLSELNEIERASDKTFNQTALRHIFRTDPSESKSSPEEIIHEGILADTCELNAEQRQAAASMIKEDVSVITGPPGTGKSQVVSATITNARLKGQSVLFASRNHKAIDAVVGRLTDESGNAWIIRTNAKEDPNLKYTFADAIRDLLAQPNDPYASQEFSRIKEKLNQYLEERSQAASMARELSSVGLQLAELEDEMAYLSTEMPIDLKEFLDSRPESFPRIAIQRIARNTAQLKQYGSAPSIFEKWLVYFSALFHLPTNLYLRVRTRKLPGELSMPIFHAFKDINQKSAKLKILEKAGKYADRRIKCQGFEKTLRNFRPLKDITNEIVGLTEQIKERVGQALELDIRSRKGLPADASREEMDGVRAALIASKTGMDESHIRSETQRILAERIPKILDSYPCWAVTNLSAGSRIPFLPGIFDLAIIDEASQCDIPSAIPILFRARRLGVVGDPWQLTHTSKLSKSRDTLLRRDVGIKRVDDVRFSYTENSLYNLVAGTNTVRPVFLSDTYRSVEDIAGYSNYGWYGGRLRVATDKRSLKTPYGISPGIHWTEVQGEVVSSGGSGCHCKAEATEITDIVRSMLLDNEFKGTLGILTPFRQQANRLRDALFENDIELYRALEFVNAHVDTAHGFQGDERDVIIFSLCSGPGMPVGSKTFLRETGNLFNVAVSRARAVLHVVGNREWAKTCKIPHIERLALPEARKPKEGPRGPWDPHESPWEEKFYKALVESGLSPRPQFPVAGRRLDLALVGDGNSPIKIDIEVDGDCHRNPDGTRKIDDHWRDIQLQAYGWKVLRFWTYQLREDIDACVETVLEEYRNHDG
jgi:very-short-patch-repair endonuclease